MKRYVGSSPKAHSDGDKALKRGAIGYLSSNLVIGVASTAPMTRLEER
jgi:hypothetical protein